MNLLAQSFAAAILSSFLLMTILPGCATFPPATATRPAYRTAGDARAVAPGSYTLGVRLDDPSTSGDGAALRADLAAIIDDMLQRRGFTRVGTDAATAEAAEYHIGFSYTMTTRHFDEYRSETSEQHTTTTSWEAQERMRKERERQREEDREREMERERERNNERRHGRNRGDSTVIDTVIVGKTENTKTTTTVTTNTELTRHAFVATLEVGDAHGAIWQADVRWESESPNVLPRAFHPLKYMLAELPAVPRPVRVDRVREGMAEAFYRTYCAGRRFASPALAYEISFGEWEQAREAVREPAAFQAYLDLLEYALHVLPVFPGYTDFSDTDPARRTESYILGGEYFIGDAIEAVPVLVTVTDRGAGSYRVTDARVVTRGVYLGFLDDLERWREVVDARGRIFE